MYNIERSINKKLLNYKLLIFPAKKKHEPPTLGTNIIIERLRDYLLNIMSNFITLTIVLFFTFSTVIIQQFNKMMI